MLDKLICWKRRNTSTIICAPVIEQCSLTNSRLKYHAITTVNDKRPSRLLMPQTFVLFGHAVVTSSFPQGTRWKPPRRYLGEAPLLGVILSRIQNETKFSKKKTHFLLKSHKNMRSVGGEMIFYACNLLMVVLNPTK